MGKHESKKPFYKKNRTHYKSSNQVILIVVLAVFLAALLMMFVIPQMLYRLSHDSAESTHEILPETEVSATEETEAEATEKAMIETAPVYDPASVIEFPFHLENGNLEIESVFQFDGANPDSNNQEGKSIASINLRNMSGTYLKQADIALTLGNGDVLNFTVKDLPAGSSAMVFSSENASVDSDAIYIDATCHATFDPNASLCEDLVSVSTEGVLVTLTNNTDAQIDEIVIYCHSLLGDRIFGGRTYTYTVNNLSANGTAEVNAVDCFLGLAEVVRVVANQS